MIYNPPHSSLSDYIGYLCTSAHHFLARSSSNEAVLIRNDTNFGLDMPDPVGPLTAPMTSTGNNNDNNAAGSREPVTLKSLPPELLLEIADLLSPEDRITAAFTLPEVFLTQDLHIFYYDAERHLNLPSRDPDSTEQEDDSLPLVINAIRGKCDTHRIGRILDFYEAQCIRYGLGPEVFLNSAFPNNRPADSASARPTRAPGTRNVIPPLHAALEILDPTIIRYLLKRGADVNQVYETEISGEMQKVNPLQYVLSYDAFPSEWPSREEMDWRESIALELLDHYPSLSPYMHDLQNLSREMELALRQGFQNIALRLVKRAEEPADGLDPQRLQTARNMVLDHVIQSIMRMPQLLRYILERGARYEQTESFTHRVYHSIYDAARDARNCEHMTVAVRWEAEMESPHLGRSMELMSQDSRHDTCDKRLWAGVQGLAEAKHADGLTFIFVNALLGEHEAHTNRSELLQNSNDMLLNGVVIRFCIFFRDRTSLGTMLGRLADLGRSSEIDEYIDQDHILAPPPEHAQGFSGTPLTYALVQQSYAAASDLLTFGANPDLVPNNMRHRLRAVEDSLAKGAEIQDLEVMRRGMNIHRVCCRTLDGETRAFPGPECDRNGPADDSQNDSDHEDHEDHVTTCRDARHTNTPL
ncbi:hypothetical protein F5Y01DRAFT_320380 [Xylaria sp. FL0043]|nr:hypothetical protein F5Y01DRAFT_320380 [Xylaria sp. FL0043]